MSPMDRRTVDDLQAIREDASATQTEKDVARRVQADITAGWRPCQDHISVLQGYVAKQYQQDRYGK
jgi:hypothetical protein